MAIQLEIKINNEDPIVAGFKEASFGASAIVSIGSFPDTGQDIGINVGGMVRDTKIHFSWLDERLKVGDEIRIRIVEGQHISEPKEKVSH